jgi:deoxycytidylate deaminase
MNHVKYYFKQAAKMAIPNNDNDRLKNYWLGAVGIRADNALVYAKNLPVVIDDEFYKIKYATRNPGQRIKSYQKQSGSHAEARCLQKMPKNSEAIYIVRISKTALAKGKIEYAMARPCQTCEIAIRAKKIKKVYYSINDFQYGIYHPELEIDTIHEI